MEFGLREVLIGVGLLVIAAILIHGFIRMQRSKAGSLDLPTEMGGSADEEWGYYKGELPNGGARAVSLRKEPKVDEADQYETGDHQEPGFGAAAQDEQQYAEESLYAESEDRYEPQPQVSARRVVQEPDAFADPGQTQPAQEETYHEEISSSKNVQDDYDKGSLEDYVNETLSMPPRDSEEYEEIQTDLFEDDEMLARAKAEQERKLASHYDGGSAKKAERAARRVEPKQEAPEPVEEPEDDIELGVQELADVIVINVMAKPGEELYGEDLYRAVSSCGFHHGDMDIFHRYEQHNGQGRLLFSVANCVEPGTFDPKNMNNFTTPGICMFLKLPGPKRSLQAFDVLLDSARRISKLLGADMKDENHSVMTQQTFEHYRQRVVEFERKQQLSQKALVR